MTAVTEVPDSRRVLFDLVAVALSVGLPVPDSVHVSAEIPPMPVALLVWMACPADLAAWAEQFDAPFEAVSIYPRTAGGWQWSFAAEVETRIEGCDCRLRLLHCQSLDTPGPVDVPGWLLERVGFRPAAG